MQPKHKPQHKPQRPPLVPPAVPQAGSVWRHLRTREFYQVTCLAYGQSAGVYNIESDWLVVYAAVRSRGPSFVRGIPEFLERFTHVHGPTQAEPFAKCIDRLQRLLEAARD
jgi:hypothetical protein